MLIFLIIFQKKVGDILRVGAGGGVCFCGLNLYFKNEKFYDDWVMPVLRKLDPATASKMTLKAAQYDLIPKSKLAESNILVSNQPTSEKHKTQSQKDENKLIPDEGNDFSTEDFPERLNFESDEIDILMALDDEFSDSASLNEFKNVPMKCKGPGCAFRLCDSPRSDLGSTAPDSPSLSTRVNIDSPLRHSRMSLTELQEEKPPLDEVIHIIIPNNEPSPELARIETDDTIPALEIASEIPTKETFQNPMGSCTCSYDLSINNSSKTHSNKKTSHCQVCLKSETNYKVKVKDNTRLLKKETHHSSTITESNIICNPFDEEDEGDSSREKTVLIENPVEKLNKSKNCCSEASPLLSSSNQSCDCENIERGPSVIPVV